MRNRLISLITLLLLVAVVAACGPSTPEPPSAKEPSEITVAAIFPGPITDADYNTLGFNALEAVKNDIGVETVYSDSVAVPDVERVMREYVDSGADIIWTHGGQFFSQTQELAKEFPNVQFIAEFDTRPEDHPENLWVIDRNLHLGFYPLGVLAAKKTETGKIGYIGGLTLPILNAEAHAVQQALDEQGLDVEYEIAWAGDFNDPTKAREIADAMIANDVDVIIGSLNLGMLGIFEAAKSADRPVWVIAKYTDKSEFAPDNYLTSMLMDFEGPLTKIVQNILDGESTGYYPLGFNDGILLQFPVSNVSPELNDEIKQLAEAAESGEIEIIKNTEPIE